MSESVVADASLAFKWIVDEVYAPEARSLLSYWRSNDTAVLAPSLFFYEISNALYRRVRRGDFTLMEAASRFRALQRTGVQALASDENLHLRAIDLAYRIGVPAAYDAHYLALAEREKCELWTADERLWNTVKPNVDWVRWIGEQALPHS